MTSTLNKDNIAIVLCPSSFSPVGWYAGVHRKLVSDGFGTVQECRLLSACPATDQIQPPANLEDDALYIREVLQGYLSTGKDVILVMNAYAGFPGTEAIKNLRSLGSLSAPGTVTGAVVGMIYLSSFLPHPGDSLRSLMSEHLFEPLKTGSKGEYITMPEGADRGIFNDLYAEGRDDEAQAAAKDMLTQSSDSFDGQVTNDMWSKPENFKGKVVYIMGEIDMVVPPAVATSMIEKVNKMVEGKVKVVKVKGGGHVTHVSKPDIVTGVIEDLVEQLSWEK